MPRKPRFFLPNSPVHIVQRGHSKAPVFFEDSDFKAYLNWLREGASRYKVDIHAFVLMTNHVHMLLSSPAPTNISRMMQLLGRYYSPYINKKHNRSGSIWEGRFKSSLVSDDQYLLTCMRYIELNPVRAMMVSSPSDYRWSSFHHNIGAKNIRLITPHTTYLALGERPHERSHNYLQLFEDRLSPQVLRKIRDCLQSGTPLGNSIFVGEVEDRLKVKVGKTSPGRPRKQR